MIYKYCIKEQFDKEIFEKLNKTDQRIVYHFFISCHVDVNIDNVFNKDELQEQFDMLKGEIEAGKNNPDISKKIKTLIKQAILSKQISAKQGLLILEDL